MGQQCIVSHVRLTGDEDTLFSDAPVHSYTLSVRMENPTPTFYTEI